jgi:hypothetical protein
MLAWMVDDYGDGEDSKQFLGYQENQDQKDAAAAARKAVKEHVGAFKDILGAAANMRASKRQKELSDSMTAMSFKIQWLHADAKKAEESFYRINLRSVALNRTEIQLIRNRRKPKPIATRAIVQNASGHAFWNHFPKKQKDDTVKLAKEVHALLFAPPLQNVIKTAHLSIGGKSYAGTAMEIALEVVEFANKTPLAGSIGRKTVDVLQNSKDTLAEINGDRADCLGLHPAVYFYSHATGKHQPASLMAILKWFSGFDKYRFRAFTSVRKYFEEFLISNARALGEIVSTRGSKGRAVGTFVIYYDLVLNELIKGSPPKKILNKMRRHPKLSPFAKKLPDFTEYGKEFSTETKSAEFLIDALNGAPKCRVCGARYQPDSVNSDHRIPKSEGGTGTPKNHGPTHYYCNGGKNALAPLIEAARLRIEAQAAPTPTGKIREQAKN